MITEKHPWESREKNHNWYGMDFKYTSLNTKVLNFVITLPHPKWFRISTSPLARRLHLKKRLCSSSALPKKAPIAVQTVKRSGVASMPFAGQARLRLKFRLSILRSPAQAGRRTDALGICAATSRRGWNWIPHTAPIFLVRIGGRKLLEIPIGQKFDVIWFNRLWINRLKCPYLSKTYGNISLPGLAQFLLFLKRASIILIRGGQYEIFSYMRNFGMCLNYIGRLCNT